MKIKIKNKTTGQVIEVEKNENGTYTINGKEVEAKDMSKDWTVVKPPIVKPVTQKSTTEQLTPLMGGNLEALFKALSIAQGSMETGKKNVEGYGYQYMDMSQVIDISKEPLSKNGLAVIQMPSTYVVDDLLFVRITTTVTHSAGGYISSHFDSPVKESKKQALIQTIGTNCSYMARYARNNILGISADKDTDGV